MLIVNLAQDASSHNKYISETLLSHIDATLEKKEKVLLYLNKRGSFESLICNDCSHMFLCMNCDSSMTVHDSALVCHICGYKKPIPKTCEVCDAPTLHKVGVGTKQIEQFLKKRYGERIFRLDTDVVKNKTEKANALGQVENADIIIGTKMLTTGFDFENIGLVGVILLEQELQFPSYKAEEQLYANIKQFLGRGGRKGQKTTFILQTFIPEHPFVEMLSEGNAKAFFLHQIAERKNFRYPPFYEFVTLEYRHSKQEKALSYINDLHTKLESLPHTDIEIFKNTQYSRRYNQYYYKIVLKGKNIRDFLAPLKKEIFREKYLTVRFE